MSCSRLKTKKKIENWFMVKSQNLDTDSLNSDYFRKAVSDSWIQILHSSLTTCLEAGLAPFLGAVGFGSFIFQTNHLTSALDPALHVSDCFQHHLKETRAHGEVLWVHIGCSQHFSPVLPVLFLPSLQSPYLNSFTLQGLILTGRLQWPGDWDQLGNKKQPQENKMKLGIV